MKSVTIPIPGGSTRFDDAPSVTIRAHRNESVHLIIRYIADYTHLDKPIIYGEITFHDVLEYRWIDSFVEYEDFPEHAVDYEFGLIQIEDSRYIEKMASSGPRRAIVQQRFGETIREEDVKHYRLAFDDYGRFDVIALGVTVQAAQDTLRPD